MRRRDERGVGTMLTVGIALATFVVTGAAAVVIGWFGVVRHAEQVAELSALAGVAAAVRGAPACEGAEQAAAHNGAELSRCLVRGQGADVVVEVGVSVALTPTLRLAPERVERLATAGTM